MIPDLKFTDEMVRKDPELLDVAVMYAKDYQGDWSPMVSAHELAWETDSLPVPVARMVLNVLRADPDNQDRVPPRPAKTTRRGHLTVVRDKKPKEPSPVRTKTTWKMKYILSTHKKASVAHLLRPGGEYRGWGQYTNFMWSADRTRFDVHLHTWCGKYWSQHSYPDKYVYSPLNAKMSNDTEGRKVCKQCQINEEKYG